MLSILEIFVFICYSMEYSGWYKNRISCYPTLSTKEEKTRVPTSVFVLDREPMFGTRMGLSIGTT